MNTHKHQCGLITVDENGNTQLLDDFGCHRVFEHVSPPPGLPRTDPTYIRSHHCPYCGQGPWYAEYRPASGFKRVLALLTLATLSGCAVVPAPTTCFANYDHVSHPLQGRPFGPPSEEDALDAIGTTCRWEKGRVFLESGLSYQFPASDLYGDDLLFNSRVAYKIWEE